MVLKQEKKTKGHYIICHQDNVELSDEHVIPDSMGGYIHCYDVCKNCNSNMGDHVDNHLLNHFFIQGARHNHQLRGKKNGIPNPLKGDATLKSGEKVRVEEVDGVIIPHLLPQAPVVSDDNRTVEFVVDKKDENLIPGMQQKMIKKLGLKDGGYKIETKRVVQQIEHPVVEIKSEIDLKKYKIGILKIAYESCVMLCSQYENDILGQKYAEIIHDASIDRLDEVPFYGDGWNDLFEPVLSQLLDYSNKKRHYIVFFGFEGCLYCMVKLFDMFSQVLKMSDSAYLDELGMVLYINDFEKHQYEVLTMEELADKVTKETLTHYKFDKAGMELMSQLMVGNQVGISANCYGSNLVYNCKGDAVLTEEQLLQSIPEEKINETDDLNGSFKTLFNIPSGFFFRVEPSNQLVQLSEIELVTIVNKY